jgi:hypothetical protein
MLNIFLEYVPGGSIYSLLKKFGSFPEDVIRTYTKRILVGLEYLHAHNIIHRGPSIAVDTAAGVALWYSSSWFGVVVVVVVVVQTSKAPTSWSITTVVSN